jgi:DNA transformation protein
MPTADPFVSRLLSALAPLGPVESRPMFGGHGLYLDGRFFAIVHAQHVYFRVDAATADVAAEGEPFRYRRSGRTITLAGYREPPAACRDAGEALLPWAERGVAAAKRETAKKPRAHRSWGIR